MSLLENFRCSICDSSELKMLWPVNSNADGQLETGYQLLVCARCSSGHTFPLPDSEVIGGYYEQGIYKQSGGRAGRIIDALLSLLSEIRLGEINKAVGPGRGLLLDIGCGKGRFLATAVKHHWQVYGTDVSATQVSAAQARYGLDIFHGELETAQFLENSFNVVTAWHVLEHLSKPHLIVQEVHRILAPGGIFVFEVPNLASWQASIGRENWFQLDVPRHLIHYTILGMTKLVEQHDFQVKEIHTLAVELGFFGMLQSTINRLGILPPNSLFQWLKKSRPYSLPIVLANIFLAALLLIPCVVLEFVAATARSGGVVRMVVVKK
ncbi:MAG: class I SAM-dependent methyltransferase [Chloroflexi bacterium]|nr:class I SAM-dependent methyltransferase [Chloroflexota bacterium]